MSSHTQSTNSWSESEERFRVLAEILPVGICQTDIYGKALFINESWSNITGLKVEQMQSKRWLKKLITTQHNDIYTHWLEKAKQHKKSTSEYQIKHEHNSFRWVKGTTVGLYSKNNELKGFLITITDITQQKHVQAELSIYKDRLDQAQKAGHIGIFDWDLQKNTIFWSSQQEKLFGFKQGTFSGRGSDIRKVIHPQDVYRVQKEVEDAITKREDYTSQFRIIHPNKSIHWLITKGKLYFNKDNNPIRMVGISIDITDEKRTESYRQFFSEASKILSFSLDYQTTLNNIAQIAIPTFGDWCSVDMLQPDGNIKLVALAHQDPKKVKWALKLREKTPAHIDIQNHGIALVIKTGKSQFYPTLDYSELEKTTQDKKTLQLLKKIGVKSAMVVPLFSAHNPIGAITFITSESQRHYTKEDLNMAEELAERASLAIDNARLFLSEERAVAAREEFISIASHELKTPITSIKAFNQILKKKLNGTVDETVMKIIERSEGQIDRLIMLVRDLLDVTKIQSGKLLFSEEKIDIYTLVTEIVDDFQLIKKSHDIELEGKVHCTVKGDKDRLGQVINNLISNAIKYSPNQKKIVIRVSHDGKLVTVEVQDFGIGIDKSHLPRVFERFFRASQSEEGSMSSLGLGLYISAEIIRRHGGHIGVRSKKGKGSTFYFKLPMLK